MRNATAEAHKNGVKLPYGLKTRKQITAVYDDAEMFTWCLAYAPCFLQLNKNHFDKAVKALIIDPADARIQETLTGTIPTTFNMYFPEEQENE